MLPWCSRGEGMRAITMRSCAEARKPGQASKPRNIDCLLHGLSILLLAMGTATCAHTTDEGPRAPDTESAQVLAEVLESAQSECEIRTPPDPRDVADTPPRVFVEAYLLEVPQDAHWQITSSALVELSRVPRVKLVASPHIIARLDTATTMDLGTRIMPLGASLEPGMFFKGMTVQPHSTGPAELILDLDLALDTLEPEAEATQSAPVERHVRNTFILRDRKTAMLDAPVPGYSRGSLLLLLKPYVITGQHDLRDIFTCKMQLRQRVVARRVSAGGKP